MARGGERESKQTNSEAKASRNSGRRPQGRQGGRRTGAASQIYGGRASWLTEWPHLAGCSPPYSVAGTVGRRSTEGERAIERERLEKISYWTPLQDDAGGEAAP